MTATNTFTKRIAAISTLTLVMAMLSSCGEQTLAKVTTGGTGSYGSGPVNGLGSIIVNDIRFDDSSASLVDTDDTALSNRQIGLGTVVEVEGGALSNDAQTGLQKATAKRIKKRAEVQGPISSYLNTTMQINGVQVNIKPSTVLVGCSTSAIGQQYATVYGFSNNSTNQVLATRIECQSNNFRVWLRKGIIGIGSIGNQVINLGGVSIDISSSNLPIAPLVVGMPVTVIMAPVLNNGMYSATRIFAIRPSLLGSNNDDRYSEVEGEITAIHGAQSIAVDGLTINLGNIFTSPLSAGMRVRVKGNLVNGVLFATRLDIKNDTDDSIPDYRFIGPITAINMAQSTITIKGETVAYNNATDFRAPLSNASSLVVDMLLEVRALTDSQGKLVAYRIELED